MIKTFEQFINESLIVEKFSSATVKDFFDNIKKSFMLDKIKSRIMWDAVSQNDIELCNLGTAIKRIGQDNTFIIFKFGGNIVAYSYGDMYNIDSSLFPRIKTIKGLSKQIAGAQCLIVNNYDKWSTSELKKSRAEAKKGAIALQDCDDILYDNKRKLEKILPIFKAYKRLDVTDLEKIYNKVTDTLMRVMNVMRYNEDLLLGYGYGLYNDESGLQSIVRDYQNIIRTINSLTGKDTEATDWRRTNIGKYDVENVIKHVNDFKNGNLDDSGIEYYQTNNINNWVNMFDSLMSDVRDFCNKCQISDEDLRLTNI